MVDPAVIFPLTGRRVWVAGHHGMVGSALVRRLAREGVEILTVNRGEVDLTRQADVERWLQDKRPQAVFLAAAKVGGILANNTGPAEFIRENLLIEANIIHEAFRVGVEKLLFLGSSCIYPKYAPQPIREECLLTGPLEPTNRAYAVAKIAGIELCRAYRWQHGCDFVCAMPTNLYGPRDNFDLMSSHVLPALIAKTHNAKERNQKSVNIWGSGEARREFLYVDDCADALVYIMKTYSDMEHLNVGSGEDVTINQLAQIVAATIGFNGRFDHDRSKPDGTPQKLLDVSRLRALGWQAETSLSEGIRRTYQWYLQELCHAGS
jgi:GDP-L-fucose synthase